MKVELLVSEWCPTCPQAEQVWSTVSQEKDIAFAVLDLAQPEGRELAHRLRLKTIPAVVVDGKLVAVGVQSLGEARQLVAAAPQRAKSSPLHAGMMLSRDNRWFIVTAMVYLVLSGAWILAQRALVSDGVLRPVGVHLFTTGFVLNLIYGMGAHMLPRFTGNPIRLGTWPWAQYACINIGIILFTLGYWLGERVFAMAGGVLMWISLLIFFLRIGPLLWTKPVKDRQSTISIPIAR
jgi:glutaredoxin